MWEGGRERARRLQFDGLALYHEDSEGKEVEKVEVFGRSANKCMAGLKFCCVNA